MNDIKNFPWSSFLTLLNSKYKKEKEGEIDDFSLGRTFILA